MQYSRSKWERYYLILQNKITSTEIWKRRQMNAGINTIYATILKKNIQMPTIKIQLLQFFNQKKKKKKNNNSNWSNQGLICLHVPHKCFCYIYIYQSLTLAMHENSQYINFKKKRRSKCCFIYQFFVKMNKTHNVASLVQFVLYIDRKSTRLNSSHAIPSRMPSSA